MYLSQPGKRKETILRFSNLKKGFNGRTVLNNISFDIYDGDIFGLIGSSGAGKTTLLRIIIGYYSPDSGFIFYKNHEVSKNLYKVRRVFGFSTQDNCFYEELSVLDNLKYFGSMYGVTGKNLLRKSEKLLKLVELWDYKNLEALHLSGGMQRRLDLAISMIHDPDVLILDEPTSGLDPLLRKSMWNLIRKINSLGVTIIMSSHLLDEMEDLCDDVAMIKNGNLLVKGSPEQLKAFYSKNQEVWVESSPGNYKKLLKGLQEKKILTYYPRREGARLVFYTPDTNAILRALPVVASSLKEKLKEVRIEKPTLNEVFEALSNYTT